MVWLSSLTILLLVSGVTAQTREATIHRTGDGSAFVAVPDIKIRPDDADVIDLVTQRRGGCTSVLPDGTSKGVKSGDCFVDRAAEKLTAYPRPWTLPKLLSWYRSSDDKTIRAALLRVLGASQDPRGAVVLGEALDDMAYEVRNTAAMSLKDYFMGRLVSTDSERHYEPMRGGEAEIWSAQKWWEKHGEQLTELSRKRKEP